MEMLDKIVVTDIIETVTVSSEKGRVAKIENRSSYGLSFCIGGQISYLHKGKTYISDDSCAVILPKGESYELFGDKSGVFPVINFECNDFLCDTIMVLPIENPDVYIKEYEQMKSLILFENNRTKIISLFYGLLYRLSREGGLHAGILSPAIKYLENNYSDSSLNNNTLAKLCGVSEVYFRKLFLKAYGTTPKQYVVDVRIEKAKQLLTDGAHKINRVSELCGFTNPYHFCRVFKEKAGITPSEYMRNNRIFKI